ncbi:hypothetical protein P8452_56799 [Trifolium repens]|nr:hypothetical protein P8452_56799 [Trifolium repens]
MIDATNNSFSKGSYAEDYVGSNKGRVFPPLFATMVDPYFYSLKNADIVVHRFKVWNELNPAGAPFDTSQLQSTSQFWFWFMLMRFSELQEKEVRNRIMAQENDGCQVSTLNENKTPALREFPQTDTIKIIKKDVIFKDRI